MNLENRKCPSCNDTWKGKVLFLRCTRSCFRSMKWQLISIYDVEEYSSSELSKRKLLKRFVMGNLVFKKNTDLILDAIREVMELYTWEPFYKTQLFQMLNSIEAAIADSPEIDNRWCHKFRIFLIEHLGPSIPGPDGEILCSPFGVVQLFNENTQKYNAVFDLIKLLEQFGRINLLRQIYEKAEWEASVKYLNKVFEEERKFREEAEKKLKRIGLHPELNDREKIMLRSMAKNSTETLLT